MPRVKRSDGLTQDNQMVNENISSPVEARSITGLSPQAEDSPGLTDALKIKELEAQLKKEKESTLKQRGLLLNQANSVESESPYQIAINDNEISLVERHNKLVAKYNDPGLTQIEHNTLLRTRLEIDQLRGKVFDLHRTSQTKGDQLSAQVLGQRRKLHIDGLPEGYHHRWIREDVLSDALRIGYRLVSDNGSISVEADSESWNPTNLGSARKQQVGIDKQGQPMFDYLCLEPVECWNERQRKKYDAGAISKRENINGAPGTLNQQVGEGKGNAYGHINIKPLGGGLPAATH